MAAQGPSGIPIPRGVGTPLSLATFQGALTMDRSAPQHEIPDTSAYTIVDCNLNDPGFVRRRGPLTATGASGAGKTNRYPLGIARCQDPTGTEQLAVYTRTTTPGGELYGIGNTTALVYAWPYTPAASSPADLFDSKDALLSGTLLGSASSYDNPTNKALLLWQGASKNTATNLAVSAVARGDTTITVTAAIASCAAGHFVFDHTSGSLVGVVKSISGSVITLKEKALAAAADHIDVKPLRGLTVRTATGRITCSTTSQVVNGGETKFSAQGLASGTWDLFTFDKTYIGTVASVQSDIQLTLSGASGAGVALTSGEYIAVQRDASYAATPFGWLNAQFAGHQFYADGNKLWFSDPSDREAVDTTADGDYITFSADPIRALIPTLASLVVVTETQAFALVGAVGTTPDLWRGQQIHDDGTICGMAAMSYKGGAIWAGKRGVWFYDGATPVNVVDKLDGDYRLFVSTFTSATDRAYCGLVKDHYLFWLENGKSGVFDIIKNAVTTHITRPTIVVSLATGAVSLWRNVEIRGCVQPPDSAGLGTALLPIQTLEAAVNTSRVIDGEQLFVDSGNDSWTCNGSAGAGPDLYVETKKYSMGDGQRLKLFRMLLLNFWAAGGNIRFDTVSGLNSTGATSSTEFLANTSFDDKRIKFNKRTQYLALRLYQSTFTGLPANNASASITRITIGQWALGFKWKRPGRV